MIDTRALSSLIDIAERAIAFDIATQKRRRANEDMRQAYRAWKIENQRQGFMEAGSPDMERMYAATEEEFRLLGEAKSSEANARRRLEKAIRRYRGVTENG